MKHYPIDLPTRVEFILALVAAALSALLTVIGYEFLSHVFNSAFDDFIAAIPGSPGIHVSLTPVLRPVAPFAWLALTVRLYFAVRRFIARGINSL
ncbi:MAG: hypothetical protein P4L99_19865 [Chthoniobacter sp.]|nr:hypothetical protein [Chthoniobacter sp.]